MINFIQALDSPSTLKRSSFKGVFKFLAKVTILALILEMALAPGLVQGTEVEPEPGMLIKVANNSAVYYVGNDMRRYPFPDRSTFLSWYPNYDNVQVISLEDMNGLTLGPRVNARPNVRFVKFGSDPKLFAVEPGGILRWIPNRDTMIRFGLRGSQITQSPALATTYFHGPALTGLPVGTIIRVGTNGPLYYFRDNVLHPITLEVMNLNRRFASEIRQVLSEAVEGIPIGDPITGYDINIEGRPDMFVVEDNEVNHQVETLPSFTANPASGQASLNWQVSPTPGIQYYFLYISLSPINQIDQPGVSLVKRLDANATSYTVKNLNGNTTYYFAIRGQSGSGDFSPLATTQVLTLPTPPTNLRIKGGNFSNQLNWVLSNSLGVDHYELYRSATSISNPEAPGVTHLATLNSNRSNYFDSGLSRNLNYHYALKAVLTDGSVSSLVKASARTINNDNLGLNPPTALTAEGGDHSAVLNWSQSASPEITEYVVYRHNAMIGLNPSNAMIVATVPAGQTSYTVTGLIANTQYHFAVKGRTNANLYTVVVNAGDRTMDNGVAPAAPTDFTPAWGAYNVSLSWTLSASPNIQNYKIYRSANPIVDPSTPGVSNIATLPATATAYNNGGLNPNNTYYYAIRALNTDLLYSPLQTISGSPTGPQAPNSPTNFSAAASGLNSINLNWTLSNSQNIQSYLIYRALFPISDITAPGVSQIASRGATVNSYANTGLSVNTTYYYAIRARNSYNLYSPIVTSSATTQGGETLNPPTNFVATANGQTSINLSWILSSSPDIQNQYLYRASFPITDPTAPGVSSIATLDANAAAYQDNGLTLNTTYYYAIKVRDNDNFYSPLATASATTENVPPPNAPTNFTATAMGQTSIYLSWTLSSSPDIQNQYLYRSLAPITDPTAPGVSLIATLSASATSGFDSGLSVGTTYYYALRVRNSGNVYSGIVTASATTLGGQTPNPPTNFTATANGENSINLSWTLSASPNIQNQYLYRAAFPITNPTAPGVSLIATFLPSVTSYTNNGLEPGTTYYYAIRVRNNSNLYSALANASAATDGGAPMDRLLLIPDAPDNIVYSDGLQWAMNTVTTAASMGINKIVVPVRYYQGLNDLDPSYPWGACHNHIGRMCTPYHQFLNFTDTLETSTGQPVEVIFQSAKLTKGPMTGDSQQRNTIRLKRKGATPYNFSSRPSALSGTLPPGNQGENRAFITVNFPSSVERDRLLRLTTNISGTGVLVRWYPQNWDTAKFRDTGSDYQQGLGLKTFDFPNPAVGNNTWIILIMNTGTTQLNWQIQSLVEVDPDPASVRSQDSNFFEWLGNNAGFTTYGHNHARYALNETSDRYINVMTAVWNEYSSHPSLIGLYGEGDEPHAMYWAEEETAAFQNAGHLLSDFEKRVANGQYVTTNAPLMIFGDPRDPTHNGLSTGVYASNMAGGGFSDMATRFNGTEPIEWILWGGTKSTGEISGFTSQGFDVYLMEAMYVETFPEEFARWQAAASALPAAEKARVKGWYYYAEQREHVTQSILEQAVNSTPGQL